MLFNNTILLIHCSNSIVMCTCNIDVCVCVCVYTSFTVLLINTLMINAKITMSCLKFSATFYCELLVKQYKRNKVYSQYDYCRYSTILTSIHSEIRSAKLCSEIKTKYVLSNLPVLSQYTDHNLTNTLHVWKHLGQPLAL